jgi:Tol biopolymer transport system component
VVYEERVLYTIGLGWGLCSIRTDGSDKIISPDSDLFGLRSRKMDVADEWVYVLGFSKNIFKIKSDGSEYTRLNDHDIYDFCIDGEWIYYLEEKEDEKFVGFQLWRMQTDGTQKQQLMQEPSFSIDYDENWIYYIDNDEDIYKIAIEGTERKRILECDSGLFLKVIGDWVYYEDRGDKPGIYKVKTVGSERTFITNDTEAFFYTVWDNWLLCLGTERISVIRVGESEETDEIIMDIIFDWPYTEIYE